jgi:hypothetical protein
MPAEWHRASTSAQGSQQQDRSGRSQQRTNSLCLCKVEGSCTCAASIPACSFLNSQLHAATTPPLPAATPANDRSLGHHMCPAMPHMPTA